MLLHVIYCNFYDIYNQASHSEITLAQWKNHQTFLRFQIFSSATLQLYFQTTQTNSYVLNLKKK